MYRACIFEVHQHPKRLVNGVHPFGLHLQQRLFQFLQQVLGLNATLRFREAGYHFLRHVPGLHISHPEFLAAGWLILVAFFFPPGCQQAAGLHGLFLLRVLLVEPLQGFAIETIFIGMDTLQVGKNNALYIRVNQGGRLRVRQVETDQVLINTYGLQHMVAAVFAGKAVANKAGGGSQGDRFIEFKGIGGAGDARFRILKIIQCLVGQQVVQGRTQVACISFQDNGVVCCKGCLLQQAGIAERRPVGCSNLPVKIFQPPGFGVFFPEGRGGASVVDLPALLLKIIPVQLGRNAVQHLFYRLGCCGRFAGEGGQIGFPCGLIQFHDELSLHHHCLHQLWLVAAGLRLPVDTIDYGDGRFGQALPGQAVGLLPGLLIVERLLGKRCFQQAQCE